MSGALGSTERGSHCRESLEVSGEGAAVARVEQYLETQPLSRELNSILSGRRHREIWAVLREAAAIAGVGQYRERHPTL